ncbi:MAG: FGGY-family carbohydrate kinase [Desulfobacterales bacterium]|nr:MAG: FGGY-family carbohydrate kinase [Desulfobacterales bacterium]
MADDILSIDLGTTSTKVVIIDRNGKVLGAANAAYETQYTHTGWAEQNPLDWWQAMCRLVPQVLAQCRISAKSLACVVFSGKTLGLTMVDADGNLARAQNLIYQDTRSVEQAARFLEHFGHERFYSITGGGHTPAIYPVFKMIWLKENEPEIYQATRWFLQAKSFIIHRLTGNFVSDYSDASQTGMLDLKKKAWSSEILDAAELPIDRLPKIRHATDIVGHISRDAARQTSLMEGTPVTNGGGDVLCACAGAGVIEEGIFYINIGSAGWWGTATAEPLLNFKARQLCLAHIVPNTYAPHLTMYNGANCEQWIRQIAFRRESEQAENDAANIYEIIQGQAAKIPPGSQQLIFLPYLTGAGAPIFSPDARGAFVGLSMQHDRRHLYRAALEGVSFQLRRIYEVFVGQELNIQEIRIIGGGAESPLWRQILADTLQRELTVPESLREASCLGAAMAGGIGIGMFSDFAEAKKTMIRIRETVRPKPENAEVYDRIYQIYKQSYESLADVYARLRRLS